MWASGIILKPVGIVWRTEVEEWVHVDLVVVDADTSAHHQVASFHRLIGESHARSEVVLVWREYLADSGHALVQVKDRQVVAAAAVQRTKVIPAQTPIDVELARNLPRVLPEEVDSVHDDFSFRGANGNTARLNVPREEVGEGEDVGIHGAEGVRAAGSAWIRGAIARPWPLRTVKHELAQRVAVIELIHVPLAEFAAEPELVLAHVIGDDIGQHTSD